MQKTTIRGRLCRQPRVCGLSTLFPQPERFSHDAVQVDDGAELDGMDIFRREKLTGINGKGQNHPVLLHKFYSVCGAYAAKQKRQSQNTDPKAAHFSKIFSTKTQRNARIREAHGFTSLQKILKKLILLYDTSFESKA
jgi:hypothetical protein